MPPTIVAGNWKMNTNLTDDVGLAVGVRDGLGSFNGVEVILCPPFISLASVSEAIKGSSIKVGAQNMHFERFS